MIFIYHGDNQNDSRQAFNSKLGNYTSHEALRLDSKEVEVDKVNVFLNSQSLFETPKVLALTNPFSVNKSSFDKLVPILNTTQTDIIIWQDKTLNASQTKLFPQAKIAIYRLDNKLFSCLNQIKPHNLPSLIDSLHQAYKLNMFDLLLYLVKNNIRKQLGGGSRFPEDNLKKTYLRLIELDYSNKTGELTIPKETALERILINLVK